MNIPGAMPIPSDQALLVAANDLIEKLGLGTLPLSIGDQIAAIAVLKESLGIEE